MALSRSVFLISANAAAVLAVGIARVAAAFSEFRQAVFDIFERAYQAAVAFAVAALDYAFPVSAYAFREPLAVAAGPSYATARRRDEDYRLARLARWPVDNSIPHFE